jgi:hypothetical protein
MTDLCPATLPRLKRPRFIYRGPGHRHWFGQRCTPIPEPAGWGETVVVFTCGCRATIQLSALELGEAAVHGRLSDAT